MCPLESFQELRSFLLDMLAAGRGSNNTSQCRDRIIIQDREEIHFAKETTSPKLQLLLKVNVHNFRACSPVLYAIKLN